MPQSPSKVFLAHAVVGAHSTFSVWAFAIVNELAAAAGRHVQKTDRFDRVDFNSVLRPVLLSHYPSNQIVDGIQSGDVCALFISEPPILSFDFLRHSVGVESIDALRSLTASAVANLAIGRSPHSFVIERSSERSIAAVVDLMAAHLELKVDAETRNAIAERASNGKGASCALADLLPIDLLADWTPSGPIDGPPDGRPYARILQDILDPLMALARYGSVRPIAWPTEVFTFFDTRSSPPPLNPAIAGPSRNLFYGPYLHLPPARYRVEVSLVVSEGLSDIPFILEMHAGTWLARARIERTLPGRFQGYFHLDHFDATATVEIRLRNERNVERGQLTLVELLFFPESERTWEKPAE